MENIHTREIYSKTDGNTGKRFEILDFLRGGAMILVLLHHSEFPLGSYILAFHMPLFFLLSGYLEHARLYLGGVLRNMKDRSRYISENASGGLLYHTSPLKLQILSYGL